MGEFNGKYYNFLYTGESVKHHLYVNSLNGHQMRHISSSFRVTLYTYELSFGHEIGSEML